MTIDELRADVKNAFRQIEFLVAEMRQDIEDEFAQYEKEHPSDDQTKNVPD